MSEPLSASCHCPLTLRRLDSVIPRGWDLDLNDIMEAFCADIRPLLLRLPLPLVLVSCATCTVSSDEAVVEVRKAAVPKSTQKDTARCIQIFSARTQPNGLPTYYRTLPGTVVARHVAPLAASLTHDSV